MPHLPEGYVDAICFALTSDKLFSFFYIAAFAAAAILLYSEGHRRGWPHTSLLVLVATGTAAGVIGSRLGAISFADWGAALSRGLLPTTAGKTFIGLIIVGAAGVCLARRALGFRSTVTDAYVLALPIGMAVMRLGCLAGGCCFGTPSNLPWTITYPPSSLAAAVHQLRGLTLPGASSLSVHPVQLYEIGLLIIVIAALLHARRFLKRPGSLFLLYVALHSWSRFIIEFAREGAAARTVIGLRPFQAILLVVTAACAVAIIWRERRQARPEPTHTFSMARNVTVLGVIALFLVVFRDWFSPAEQLVLVGTVLPALLAVGFQVARSARSTWSRWTAVATATASVVLLGAGSDTLPPPRIGRLSYYDAAVSGGTGTYQDVCGSIYNYDQFGAGVARTDRWSRYTRLRYGLQGYRYWESPTYPSYGARAFVNGEFRWAGLELGGLVNQIGFQGSSVDFLPCGRLRLGPSDIVYAEASVLTEESGFRPIVKLGIGSSRWESSSIHIGLSEQGLYIDPEFRTNFGLSVHPSFAFFGNVGHASLSVRYNFRNAGLAPVRYGQY